MALTEFQRPNILQKAQIEIYEGHECEGRGGYDLGYRLIELYGRTDYRIRMREFNQACLDPNDEAVWRSEK